MIRPLLVAPFLIVAACDSTSPESGGPEPAADGAGGAARAAEDVALALLPHDRGGMTAAASGTLALRGRCLVLEGGSEPVPLAFATAETSWDSSARVLRVGGRGFALGSRVFVGGGEVRANADALPWIRRPAAECGGWFWIVSSIAPA